MSKSKKNNEITKGIFTVLEKEPGKSFNYKQIAAKIGIEDANGRNELIKKLVELKEKRRIAEEGRGNYKMLGTDRSYHTGIVDITGRGNAFIKIEGMEDDVFIPSNKLNKA